MLPLKSKSGRLITLRQPQLGDEVLLYTYAQSLEKEDTYILLNQTQPVTLSEETEYLNTSLKKINAHWQVHYLAFHETQLVGSAQVSVGGRRKMHVGSFGITLLPSFRHDGLGEQLSNLVINEAKNQLQLSLITLEVFATNTIAFSLYQKLGFIEYGRLPGGLIHKGVPVDAILMYKQLAN